MSLCDLLTADVVRAATEERRTSFHFLVTGGKGSGKTHTLRSLERMLATSGEQCRALGSFVDALSDGKDHLNSTEMRYEWLNYTALKRGSDGFRALTSGGSCDGRLQFSAGTVLVVDSLDALWQLCQVGREGALLRTVMATLLDSPGCVLVASARSVNALPTLLLELRKPLVYPLPPLDEAAARRVLEVGFGADGGNAFHSLADGAEAVTPSSTYGSLLLSACMMLQCASTTGIQEKGMQTANGRGMGRYLRLLEDGASATAEAAEQATTLPTLFGLDEVYGRAHMLVSVFASARRALSRDKASDSAASGAGKLLTSLQGTSGVLLHGPSGCGKSALPRKLAAAFPTLSFFFVKCTSLFSKYLGESEEKLRQVYHRARAQAPSVVILDDIDVIAQTRGSMAGGEDASGARGGVNVNKRMLAGLLCELDGVTDNSGVLTIGTTNAPQVIDSALLRQGRLETLLFVPPLTEAAASAMCAHFFQSFEGSAEEKFARAAPIVRAAEGCAPAALRYALRKVLEQCLSDADVGSSGEMSADRPLPLPSAAAVGGVLFESAALMQRATYSFDTM